jgi:predicted naringenin-chalcone synthase
MVLQSLESAFPGEPFTQAAVWELVRRGPAMDRLTRRGRRILETVLLGNSGVGTRHFAIEPERLFTLDAQRLNEAFEAGAPALAASALRKCLEAGHVRPEDLDALFVCTCTGYLCPGVSSHLAELTGMRPDAVLHDVAGLGCGAAIPTMHAAKCLLAAHPEALVATVAVEICSAAFFLCDDPGVIVSACLFGDGASAALWRGDGRPDQWRASGFRSLHLPHQRGTIRFVNDAGGLRNQLERTVPEVAAEAVPRLFALRSGDPDAVIAHNGGRDVIDALEAAIPPYRLDETRDSLRRKGNLSSPSVLAALEDRLGGPHANRDTSLWLTAFGAGFSAYACEMHRQA